MFKRKQEPKPQPQQPCPPEHRFKITITPIHDDSLVFRGYRWLVNDFGKEPWFSREAWAGGSHWYYETYRGPGSSRESTVKTEEIARKEAEDVIQRIKDQEGREPVVIGMD